VNDAINRTNRKEKKNRGNVGTILHHQEKSGANSGQESKRRDRNIPHSIGIERALCPVCRSRRRQERTRPAHQSAGLTKKRELRPISHQHDREKGTWGIRNVQKLKKHSGRSIGGEALSHGKRLSKKKEGGEGGKGIRRRKRKANGNEGCVFVGKFQKPTRPMVSNWRTKKEGRRRSGVGW